MKVQPISIRQPEIGALVRGEMSVLIRPVGRLAALGAGDLLWVREPFHLGKIVEHLSPTAAVARGLSPFYAVDEPGKTFSIGRHRYARELPKAWHRQHLRITALDRVALHDLSDADIGAAGWSVRAAFRKRWDANVQSNLGFPRGDNEMLWAANPPALRVAFTHIAAPIPSIGGGLTPAPP